MEWLEGFFADGRVSTILGLILLDVALAVAVAVRRGEFEARRLADFFRTMVVPYLIGYMGVYGAAYFLDERYLGPFAEALGSGFAWAAWLALVANLAADILEHARALGYGDI
ncbi:MAG: hypothetical protein HPY83_09935 [Anaerolineae bacterium]|nr:hypothetical protein [Anaerolineae bacterium]